MKGKGHAPFREQIEAHRKFLRKRGKYGERTPTEKLAIKLTLGRYPARKVTRTTKEILTAK